MHSNSYSSAGIYIHIPFCKRKCPYCDFYSITDLENIVSFVRSAKREIQLLEVPELEFDSIYFGGGTPSVLNAEDIGILIEALFQKFRVSKDSEISIEVNPGTINLHNLIAYRKTGINRINIGIQSFHDPFLKFLGRIHDSHEAIRSIDMARQAGFDNIGIDLIYGLPGQTNVMWQHDLKAASEFEPEHIACYVLTYEKGTPMAIDLEQGKFQALTDVKAAGLFKLTGEFLTDAGYLHYEISNYAKSLSSRSRHNMKYWSFAPYIGIGPSAHSFIDNRRYWNVRSVDDYMASAESGNLPCGGSETLDLSQQLTETLYLGFRCSEGIQLDEFKKKFGFNFEKKFGPIVSLFESKGLMRCTGGSCFLTLDGMLLLDSVVGRFVDEIHQVDSASASNPR